MIFSVAATTTASVPSEPTKRSTRSIPGWAKYPAESFGTDGIVYVGIFTRLIAPDTCSISNWPSDEAITSPRRRSSTSPLARTTESPDTQRRVDPYLNVAAPAALVEIVPPTNAPSKVGTGG